MDSIGTVDDCSGNLPKWIDALLTQPLADSNEDLSKSIETEPLSDQMCNSSEAGEYSSNPAEMIRSSPRPNLRQTVKPPSRLYYVRDEHP